MNSTSSVYLDEQMRHDKHWRGILTRPFNKKLRDGKYILNLDLDYTDETRGTHWVGLLLKKDYLIYFGPFGVGPIDEILDLRESIIYNDFQIQDLSSTACGYYCLAFLKSVNGIEDMRSFIEKFDLKNLKKNDMVLKQTFGLRDVRT